MIATKPLAIGFLLMASACQSTVPKPKEHSEPQGETSPAVIFATIGGLT